MFKACATISNSMKFIFNEVHHEVELYSKHAQQSRENECDEVIAETFVEDEHRLQAAGPLVCNDAKHSRARGDLRIYANHPLP